MRDIGLVKGTRTGEDVSRSCIITSIDSRMRSRTSEDWRRFSWRGELSLVSL